MRAAVGRLLEGVGSTAVGCGERGGRIHPTANAGSHLRMPGPAIACSHLANAAAQVQVDLARDPPVGRTGQPSVG
jgi:hypothetical protein